MASLLEVRNISKHFGGVRAVDDLSFAVEPGEIRALIGPNGSGKTTCINLITRVYHLTGGEITFAGNRVDHLSRDKIVQRGLARTFQNLRLFETLSVLDHVLMGSYFHCRVDFFRTVLRTGAAKSEIRAMANAAHELLTLVGLGDKAHLLARSLPYGQRRLMEIARALATRPKLLFLDEPAAGMSEEEIDRLIDLVRAIRDRGISILIVEHRMRLVMNVAERIVVLNYGKKIAEGTAQEIQDNPEVITAYLGKLHEKVTRDA
jgi:branched-chain amino acid transport system ATP-binding protein